MTFALKKPGRFIPFIVPLLLMTLFFISSNQQFFFVDDNSDFDAGSMKIKTPTGPAHLNGFHLGFSTPDQKSNSPTMAASGNILPLAKLSANGNNFADIRQHAPPAVLTPKNSSETN